MLFTAQQTQKLDELLRHIFDPSEKEEIQSYLFEHPNSIDWLLENYEKKKQIIQTGNMSSLHSLLEEEKVFLL